MVLFDTHAHLACEALWPQKDSILRAAKVAGVSKITTICTEAIELERGLLLRAIDPSSYLLTAATGPNEVESQEEAFFPLVKKAAKEGLIQAVGETGLDFHWNTSSEKSQKEALIRYLELALESQLPVILHCRKAFKALIEVLDTHYIGKPGCRGGVFHCFSEGPEEALEVIKRGFFVSFSGVITYKSALSIQEAAKTCDINWMLIETDSPYLSPGKDRQKINEPAQVFHMAEKIAQLRGLSTDEVANITYQNGCRLFGVEA
jgi:TatD DNase family protein